ncbi:MAG: hypothetical protein V1826_02225 [bacterium]
MPKKGCRRKDLAKLKKRIQRTVANIPELGIPMNQVWVNIPKDHATSDLKGNDFFVVIKGLFDKPERTPKLRDQLAESVAKKVREFGYRWHSTSVRVRVQLDPPWGQDQGGYIELAD